MGNVAGIADVFDIEDGDEPDVKLIVKEKEKKPIGAKEPVKKDLPQWTGCNCKAFCVCAASGQICADCMRPWCGDLCCS